MIDFMLVDLHNTESQSESGSLIKKGKRLNEQIPELRKLFGDCLVTRLKNANWIEGGVLMTPQISPN